MINNKYSEIFRDRLKLRNKLDSSLKLQAAFDLHYKENPIDYINDWGITFDPRNDGKDSPKLMPFILFPKQEELIIWLLYMKELKERGVIEKARGTGATWTCGAFSVHQWKYEPGSIFGFGSRKADLVDKIGNPDSIFEKLKMFIKYIPNYFLPKGFSLKEHAFYMKIINPETHSTIVGEGGDNIGRGGRTSMYFVDEKAYLSNEQAAEAALSINTDVQIDISTHNGTNTIFYDKTQAYEVERIFQMFWNDDIRRDENWYNKKKKEYQSLGLMHLFAQEIDKNPDATKDRVLIPNIWVRECIDAHKKLKENLKGNIFAGLDVADEGSDQNAITIKNGSIVLESKCWGGGDSNEITTTAIGIMKKYNCYDMNYDAIGVGAGIKAVTNKSPYFKNVYSYKSSREVSDPYEEIVEDHKNKDMFANAKAQDWWRLRTLFFNTYNALNGLEYKKEYLISLDNNITNLKQLIRELSQPTFSHNEKGQIIVDKIGKDKDGNKKRKSPNLADSLVICFAKPQQEKTYTTASTGGMW